MAPNQLSSRSSQKLSPSAPKNRKEEATPSSSQKPHSSPSFPLSLFYWGEKHDASLSLVWDRLPPLLGRFIASLAVFLLGIFARGEWLIFLVYFLKYIQTSGSPSYKEESDELVATLWDWCNTRLRGYWSTWIWSTAISYIAYFGIGGFIHWYYYVRQKDRPEDWKCQPEKWLSPELERHEIMIGSVSLVFGSAISALISTYVKNGGTAIWLYLDPSEYGYIWLVLQVPIVFMYQDYLTYWHHRMYHTPFLYKNFHKLHHTYKQPTAFSVTAIHPFEFVHMQCVLLSAIFIVPVFWLNYAIMMGYVYYHGIIDHSGVNFKRAWWQPWQPDCIFHDNHHQYFHVNFGFNIEYWDKLHGTYRKKERIYREDIFYGQGKALEEATKDEILQDFRERQSENPKAYQGDKREFDLDLDLDLPLLRK